jgi:hypothetical protein
MSIKAIFPAGVEALTVHGLTQWDYGQTLEITHPDLPAVLEVHFAAVGARDAIVRVGNGDGGVLEAPIPDELLEQSRPVLAWVYVVGETSGTTMLTVTMPLQARARPTAAGPIPAPLQDKYTEALAAINAAVADFRAGNIAIKRTEEADHATTADRATTATSATSATKATQDGNGSNIAETYVKKGLPMMPVSNLNNFSGTPNWVYIFRLSFNVSGERLQFTALGVVPESVASGGVLPLSAVFMGTADKDTTTYFVELSVSSTGLNVYGHSTDGMDYWDLKSEAEARSLTVEYCPLFELPVG